MTREQAIEKSRQTLTSYMEATGHRRTPERYALLDAVYSFDGHFTLAQLEEKLEQDHFHVSRSTVYNSMRLFIELRIVMRHRFTGQTRYEARYDDEGHIHEVCTVCGRVSKVDDPAVEQAIAAVKTPRFRKDGFSLYVYGVCASCLSRISRLKKKTDKPKKHYNGQRKS